MSNERHRTLKAHEMSPEKLAELEKQLEGYARFQGTLGDGPDVLRQCLD
ncbi:MAG: hypothetical protein HYZ27_06450, partial [Deltaproteobacteria bacterium]|nr:hypothetical protein [Deltaproteobacteria bacterium]